MIEHALDARGLRCPWPALRLARLMRSVGADEKVRIVADDPRAETEISSMAQANGWSFSVGEEAGCRVFMILP